MLSTNPVSQLHFLGTIIDCAQLIYPMAPRGFIWQSAPKDPRWLPGIDSQDPEGRVTDIARVPVGEERCSMVKVTASCSKP